MGEDQYQGNDAFLEWQKQRARRVEKNEETFRAHNERRQEFEKPALPSNESAPFICECADTACWGVMELSADEFDDAHNLADHFSVLPGHVMPEFETVVEQYDHYWVVEKFTPEEVEQRLVTDAQQQ